MHAIRSCLSRCWPFKSHSARYEAIAQWDLDSTGPARMTDEELVIFEDGTQITMTLLETGIRVSTSQRPSGPLSGVVLSIVSRVSSADETLQVEIVPFLHVLFAGVSFTPAGRSVLEFSYLSAAAKTFQLRRVSGDVSAVQGTAMLKWVSDIQAKAYKDIHPPAPLPRGHQPAWRAGQGQDAVARDRRAHIRRRRGVSSTCSTPAPSPSPTNAANIARNVDLGAYDAVVPVSGDGIVNELINGLTSRPDALSALRIPIAPIPAGSGNALSVNIMGPDKVLDVAYAALNAIKGQPMPLDVCSVTQGDTRIYSFLSQAFGLMADLDMGTEWIRWVGGIRFVLGFLYGALTGRRYDVEITLKVVESDKRRMVADYNTHQRSLAPCAEGKALARGTDVRMPPLAFGRPDAALPLGVVHTRLEAPLEPGWHTFRTPVQFIVAGKLPWLSRDSMMIPLAKNDGLIDVVMVPPRSALASIKSVDGQEEGKFIRERDCYYYKVEAYRCTPLERSGYISIDGESIPYKPFQVRTTHGWRG
ncbi:ATP-NAD kinase-like domain-containing protein [Mycena olivaceomarginata]|nr:ATP-NAD kinase-like domain-containing protein [Mycena olivaceomarginata]